MRLKASLTLCVLSLMLGSQISIACAKTSRSVKFPAAVSSQITFVMPSQKVECIYTPKGGTLVYKPFDGGPELSCDRSEPRYVRVVLTPKKVRRFNNVGDQGCCGAENVLAYGSRWSYDGFSCISAEKGLTCKHRSGHGFLISRTRIKVR